jgi:hypothetical protein
METHIVRNKDGKNYNQFDEEVIECKICQRPTTMTGTGLCDYCYNAKGIFNNDEKQFILDGLRVLRGGLHPVDEFILEIKKLENKVKNL